MKCQNCRSTVTRKSKFCTSCGERIVPRTSAPAHKAKPVMPVSYAFVLVAVGVVFGFVVFKFSAKPIVSAFPTSSEMPGVSSIQSAAVSDVARELMCPCGSCSDPLDPCQCDHPDGAVTVKAFIAQKLAEGHKKPHIIDMVHEKYGDKSKG